MNGRLWVQLVRREREGSEEKGGRRRGGEGGEGVRRGKGGVRQRSE